MKNVEKLTTIRDNLLSNPNSRPSTSDGTRPQSQQNMAESTRSLTTKQMNTSPRVIKDEKILYFDFEKEFNAKTKSDEKEFNANTKLDEFNKTHKAAESKSQRVGVLFELNINNSNKEDNSKSNYEESSLDKSSRKTTIKPIPH
jgi:hypothetical protein